MTDGPITRADVEAALADFKDPETGRSVLQLGQLRDVEVTGHAVSLTLALSTHSAPLWDETQAALQETLRAAIPQICQRSDRPRRPSASTPAAG